MKNNTETIVALATAVGTGSIAIIRISGKNAISVVNDIFIGKNLLKQNGNTIHFGRISGKEKEIDQVLVSIFKQPNSYTGENTVEISCHSNHFIIEDIISSLLNKGARIANPGEFTLRAFLNNKIDLSQAEGISNIISSKSRLATRNSLLQIEGKISKKLKKIKSEIIDLISILELDLDFSEEELDIIPSDKVLKKVELASDKISDLLNGYNKAKHLSGAIEIAIIGKPNAGKSKLLNELLGEDRAIVTDTPGTTRDTIEENLTLKNMLLKISDTAGIRFSKNQVEKMGIEKTWDRVGRADLILWVIDASDKIDDQDLQIRQKLKEEYFKDAIVVANKIDKGCEKGIKESIKFLGFKCNYISAKTGEGLDGLKETIYNRINLNFKTLGEEVIVTNKRQFESLKKVNTFLLETRKSIKNGAGNEFIVLDLRNSLNELGQITGETTTEEILNNIFTGFCIGK